eukprot:COSAG06_NODE_6384_length_2956_cov_5.115156_4_plen_78_part_00
MVDHDESVHEEAEFCMMRLVQNDSDDHKLAASTCIALTVCCFMLEDGHPFLQRLRLTNVNVAGVLDIGVGKQIPYQL